MTGIRQAEPCLDGLSPIVRHDPQHCTLRQGLATATREFAQQVLLSFIFRHGRSAGLRRLLLASLPLTLMAGSAMGAEIDTRADYVVNLAGINVASVDIRFVDDGSHFNIDVGANVSGVGTLVARGTAEADAAGSSSIGGLKAEGFNLKTQANGETFSVDVDYAGGNATGFKIDPPVIDNTGRVALERKDLKGVTDPMASFILKGEALSPDLCNRTLKIFTGMERYDVDMSYAASDVATSARTGYQGPVVLCRLRYKPISGHFTNSEITNYLAQSDKILVWYAPLGASGYFIPYRVLMGTSIGDLSMVLTRLQG